MYRLKTTFTALLLFNTGLALAQLNNYLDYPKTATVQH